MVVLIIFPVILQTDINVIMLSIGGQGTKSINDLITQLISQSFSQSNNCLTTAIK